MARTTIDKATVQRYVREGLTQAEMVQRFFEETGEMRQRGSFAAAIHRYKVENPRATPRYDEHLPWSDVPVEHYCYDQRMLRALASRELGHPNKDARSGRLDAWQADMDAEGLVIMWSPALGFFRVPREAGDVGYVTVKNVAES